MIRKIISIACLAVLLALTCCVVAQASGQAPLADFPVNTDSGRDCFGGSPSMAYDGENFFMVWSRYGDIYGARVTKSGEVLDPGGIAISVGQNQNPTDYRQPSVAFDGTNYMVVWTATRDDGNGNKVNEAYGCRVTKDGQALDPQGIKLTQNGQPKIKPIGIAFDGTNYMIIWRTLADHVMGSRISTDGVPLGDPAGFKIADNGFYPSVAYDPADGIFLVAWHHGNVDNLKVAGARVDTNGNVLDQTPIVICDDEGDKEYARAAFDGTNFMVIWYDHRQVGSQLSGTCYGTRVTPQGAVLDKPAFLVADRVVGQIFPNLVFDGTDYLAVWSASASWDESNFRLVDVYAAKIGTDGKLLEKQAIPVSTSFEFQFGPSVAYGDGKYLVAWNDGRLSRMGGNSALYARLMDKGMDTKQPVYEDQTVPDVTWAKQTVPIATGAYSGVALGSSRAYLFCSGNALEYKNGAWNPVAVDASHGLNAGMYSCMAFGAGDIWCAGWAGQISNGSDESWQYRGTGNNNRLITGLWGSSGSDIWASQSYEKVFLHYDGNDSNTWSSVASASGVDVEDIAGISSDDIYAVGEKETVQHWNGSSWSLVPGIPTIQTLNAIWVGGKNDIFAVGESGAILHYDGTKWESQRTCTTEDLNDVWGASGSDVYAVGTNGAVIHYDGSSWSLENAGTDQDLTTVFGGFDAQSNTCTVWAAGFGTDLLSKTESVTPPAAPAPTDFRVDSSDTASVNLAWTQPDSTDLTGYTLEYRVSGSADWTTVSLGKRSSYSVTGLDNSLSYDFRLSAQYDFAYESAYTDTIGGRVLLLNVTFNAQNSITSDDHTLTAAYGSLLTPPAEPSKLYCVFSGWYTDSACSDGNEWDFDTAKVTGDMTLFAKWLPRMCDVAFDYQDGSQPQHISVPMNHGIPKPVDPLHTGYTFNGWYTESACKNLWDFSGGVQGDITLYGYWTPNTYTLTFKPMNGQPDFTAPAVYDCKITAPADPARVGYVFRGWFKDSQCTQAWIFNTDTVPGDFTLYAGWTPIACTVTFNPENSQPTFSVQADYDSKLTAPADPAKIGNVFCGWFKDAQCSEQWDFSKDTVPGDITLYAGWSSGPTVVSASPANYNTIQVNWNAVPGTTKYELSSSAGDQSHFKVLATVSATTYTNKSVSTGETYYYRVRAYRLVSGKKVYGDYSAVASAMTFLNAPATVSAASASYNSIKITWASVAGKSGYEVWRSADGGVSYTKIGSASSTSYTDNKGLTAGAQYSYKVMAYRNVPGKKVYSVFSTVASATPVPATPKAKATRASSSSIKVSWGSIAGASGYEVEVLVGADFEPLTDTTKTSITYTGLAKGTTYTYRVRAYRMVGGNKVYSGYSAVVSAKP